MDEATQGTLAKRVAVYKKVEADLAKMDEDLKKRKEPLLKIKALLEGYFEQMLETTGAQNFATRNGTVHWNHRVTASLADAEAFMKFVIGNQKFDLIERRASSTAVRDYCAENNVAPADIGVKLNSIRTIGVRAPTAKQQAKTA